jgi:hypothetical protein
MLRFFNEDSSGSDVIGTLTLGDSPAIRVESAYLDSWLAGLLECMTVVREGASHHEVDLVEESTPLIVDVSDGQVSVHFGNQTAFLGQSERVVAEVTSDVREIVRRYPIQNEVLAREIDTRLTALMV